MSKPNVAVIFGGRSVEHEVSVITGYQALEALDRNRWCLAPVYIARDNVWYIGDQLESISFFRQEHPPLGDLTRVLPCPDAARGKLVLMEAHPGALRRPKSVVIDCVIPATHGTYGEDGRLQGLLEMAGIPYAGSGVTGSAVGMDKLLTKAVLARAGLPFIDYRAVTSDIFTADPDAILTQLESDLSFPLMVKPAVLGSSVAVTRADTRDELRAALDLAHRFGDRILVEKALDDPTEINCAVLDGDPPVPSVLEQPISAGQLLSFDEKYRSGGKKGKQPSASASASAINKGMASLKRLIPAPIPDELAQRIRQMAVDTFTETQAGGVARVDFLIARAGAVYVNEINNIPGSFAFYLWENMGRSFRELLDRMIERAFEVNKRRNRTTYAFEANLLG